MLPGACLLGQRPMVQGSHPGWSADLLCHARPRIFPAAPLRSHAGVNGAATNATPSPCRCSDGCPSEESDGGREKEGRSGDRQARDTTPSPNLQVLLRAGRIVSPERSPIAALPGACRQADRPGVPPERGREGSARAKEPIRFAGRPWPKAPSMASSTPSKG